MARAWRWSSRNTRTNLAAFWRANAFLTIRLLRSDQVIYRVQTLFLTAFHMKSSLGRMTGAFTRPSCTTLLEMSTKPCQHESNHCYPHSIAPQDSALSPPTPASTQEWPSQEEPGSGLTASVPVSDVSAPACTNTVWPPLQPVSMAQKNKPSTMSSSNVVSIDLPTDCMAWRCWTMRQLNGCSTPAPKSSATKQWFQQLAQTKEESLGKNNAFNKKRKNVEHWYATVVHLFSAAVKQGEGQRVYAGDSSRLLQSSIEKVNTFLTLSYCKYFMWSLHVVPFLAAALLQRSSILYFFLFENLRWYSWFTAVASVTCNVCFVRITTYNLVWLESKQNWAFSSVIRVEC